jgi:hypothetical protein
MARTAGAAKRWAQSVAVFVWLRLPLSPKLSRRGEKQAAEFYREREWKNVTGSLAQKTGKPERVKQSR